MAYHLRKRRKKKLRLARTKDMALLILLADQKGFFHDHGVEIEYITVPYARKGMEMLIADEIDMATMVETNFSYLGYLKPKHPIKGFASIEKRTADNVIMRGANKTPADFIGKTIGFMPRTTSHTFINQFLKANHIDKKHIKLKPISPQALPNALIRGEIDAMSLWQPFINNTMLSMDELGLPYTHFKNYGEYISEIIIAANKSFLVKNPKTIKNILSALQEAETFFKENKNMSYQILGETMKISGQWHHKALKQYQPELALIGPSYLEKIKPLSEWIRENDTEFMGKDIPNYLDYIDNSYFLDSFPENK